MLDITEPDERVRATGVVEFAPHITKPYATRASSTGIGTPAQQLRMKRSQDRTSR